MILNALDEVLFWDNIALIKTFICQNMCRNYPHNPDAFYAEKDAFIRQHIPDRETFLSKLAYYEQYGTATWVSGRNGFSDDIDINTMIKAIKISAQVENGQRKALQASKWQGSNPDFWGFYTENVLYRSANNILELTIGAGGGTNAVMQKMVDRDCYMGVDIDFVCAKNADALAKYYQINGLGIATSLWNLPFEDGMFTAVCCNAGLEECREIQTILAEAARVLAPAGRITIHCLMPEKTISYLCFDKYGISSEETRDWLCRTRLFADVDQVKELLESMGLSFVDQKTDKKLGHIIVFEK